MPNLISNVFGAALLCATVLMQPVNAQGIDAPPLSPVYPANMACGKITSPFGALRDLDGSRRNAPHVGIDFGDFGDVVIAPADGRIVAIWPVDHGWGTDWNLLMIHSAADLHLPETAVMYYTEFDHLQQDDMPRLAVGQRIQRGAPIGVVRHPGNNPRFRAEMHMEVHKLPSDQHANTQWRHENGITFWWNAMAELVDPLALMSLHMSRIVDHHAEIEMYASDKIPAGFRGFVYPLRCHDGG